MTQRLRILHIASGDLWAGAEVQAFTLMAQLDRMPDTQVAAALMNEGTLAERLRSAGIEVQVIDERAVGPIGILWKLRKLIEEYGPDVIHTHREKENILGALANRTGLDVPTVRTLHGAREHSTSSWRAIRRRIVEGIDTWCGNVLQSGIIAVTRDLGESAAREFSPDKVVTIENGVDVEAVRACSGVAEFRTVHPHATHVGIAGRLVPVKRADLFIETAALMSGERLEREWRFHVFGDGPLRPELERLADQRGVGRRIAFHGHRHDIARCIAGLDVLVICSDHEGMPMTALEAAALGTPTVAHAVGGLVEIVPEQLLVTRHDALGYCDRILVAAGADGRMAAGNFARHVLQRFSARRNAERVRSFYLDIVARRAGSAAAFGR